MNAKDKKLKPSTARNALLLNLLATPGLGSLAARRWWEGIGQLILSVTGFILVLVWFIREMVPYYGLMFSDTPPPAVSLKMLNAGSGLFALAWIWSLVTSLSLTREVSAANLTAVKAFGAGLVKLDETKIQTALAALPAWKREGETISRTFQFADFVAAMKFVNAVADLAEQVQHHPDMDVRWNQVTLALSTHDAGGLTEKDFGMARQCEVLAQA
jgi:4a-hydroxytetrahydrobiopterin dehydratase